MRKRKLNAGVARCTNRNQNVQNAPTSNRFCKLRFGKSQENDLKRVFLSKFIFPFENFLCLIFFFDFIFYFYIQNNRITFLKKQNEYIYINIIIYINF